MKYLLSHLVKLLLILTILSTSACSSFKTEIVKPHDGKWRLTSLFVYPTGQGWSVQGQLNSYNSSGLPDGYILINIKDEKENIQSTRQVRYRLVRGTTRPRRHSYGRATFYTVFDSIPDGAIVTAELITTSLTGT